MTPQEAQTIFLEAFLHTPNSRVDYFRKKAEEGNHDPVSFFNTINEAYQKLNEYVNSYDYSAWGKDENGEPVYFKRCLNLFDLTNHKYSGM